jgi:hypothetical protein
LNAALTCGALIDASCSLLRAQVRDALSAKREAAIEPAGVWHVLTELPHTGSTAVRNRMSGRLRPAPGDRLTAFELDPSILGARGFIPRTSG